MNDETRFHKIMRWFQNHKVFAWVIVLIVVIGGVGPVLNSIDTIANFYNIYFKQTHTLMQQIDKQAIRSIPSPASYGYLYDVEGYEVEQLPGDPDHLDHPAISELLLYENGVPLAQAHSPHDQILEHGNGLYSHWKDDMGQEYILFSSSDNTDPRNNDYEYTLLTPAGQYVAIDKNKIKPSLLKNAGFRFKVDQLTAGPANSDCYGVSQVSKLEILELVDGQALALGPPHSPRLEIEKMGGGRYNYCKDGTMVWLFFSTSDNTDPRSNGRDYILKVTNE